MKYLKTNWLIKHSITVFSCVLIIVLGIAALTHADPVTTSIGENISTNSLTATGLTVDTDTLYVDNTNDRVGVGTITPTYALSLETGKSFGLGTTQWNSGDEIDGTKIKDADYGDIVIDVAGDWQVSEGEVDHGGFLGLTDDDHTQYPLLAGRAGGQTLIGGTTTTADLTLQTTSATGEAGADMHFLVGDNGGTEAMTILNNGYVGIGTSSPSQELDLIGDFELEMTTSADTGVIYKGANRFIHNFQPAGATGANTFVGVNAGNFTMAIDGSAVHASYNLGVGYYALNSLTTGNSNMALGRYALVANTSGGTNVAIGRDSLRYTQTGDSNVAIGKDAGLGVSGNSFHRNTLIGYKSGFALQTNANNNVLLGYQAGNSITTGTDNIIIGYDEDTPTATTSNHLNIGGLIYGDLSGGNVGIGTAAPDTEFEVDGIIQTTPTASRTCDAAAQGGIMYDSDDNHFYGCNGSAWVQLDN